MWFYCPSFRDIFISQVKNKQTNKQKRFRSDIVQGKNTKLEAESGNTSPFLL